MVRWYLTSFIAIVILSGCWPWLTRIGVGKLPGDLVLWLGTRRFVLPFASSVVLSLLLRLLTGSLL